MGGRVKTVYGFASSLAAALLNDLYEHPAGHLVASGDARILCRRPHPKMLFEQFA
jgi:hypothetical protein